MQALLNPSLKPPNENVLQKLVEVHDIRWSDLTPRLIELLETLNVQYLHHFVKLSIGLYFGSIW